MHHRHERLDWLCHDERQHGAHRGLHRRRDGHQPDAHRRRQRGGLGGGGLHHLRRADLEHGRRRHALRCPAASARIPRAVVPRAVAATRRNHLQHAGTDIDDWLYSELPNADLSGKKVALFGLGDSAGYSGNFCDSVGELYDCFTARGATVVGFTDQDGYDHYDSKAIRDDKFCGLMCDEQNQMDQSEDRATAWVEQLKAEGMPL